MVGYLVDKDDQSHPNNRYAATVNWFILGFQAGFRLIEWAQNRTYYNKHGTYQRNIDGSSPVFIKSYFEFRGRKGKYLDHINPIIIDDVSTVRLTWRY